MEPNELAVDVERARDDRSMTILELIVTLVAILTVVLLAATR